MRDVAGPPSSTASAPSPAASPAAGSGAVGATGDRPWAPQSHEIPAVEWPAEDLGGASPAPAWDEGGRRTPSEGDSAWNEADRLTADDDPDRPRGGTRSTRR